MGRAAAKLKIASTPLPTSRAAVDTLIYDIGEAQRARLAIQNELDATVAALKQKAEAEAKVHSDAIAENLGQVHAWCLANRDSITDDGKTKTVKFAAGEVSWRSRPPSVTLVKGTQVKALLATLAKLGPKFTKFLSVKTKLNKQAMLDDPDLALTVPGIRIGSSGEDFAVKPVALELEEVV